MVAVDGQTGVGEVLLDTVAVRLPEIGAEVDHPVGIAAVGLKVGFELSHDLLLSCRGGENHLGAVEIDEHAHVFMSTPMAGLVDADLADSGEVLAAGDRLDVVEQHSPESGVLLTQDARRGLDRISRMSSIAGASNSRVKPLPSRAQGGAI